MDVPWKIHKRERHALIEQDEVNPLIHRGTFHIEPLHVKHHASKEFVEYAYVENPDFASEKDCRIFAQSSNIAVEVYDFYNKLFDPDYENVSVYDERFEIQYLFKEPNTWRSADYYNPRIEVIPLENGVDIKKIFDTDYGAETLEITYTVRTGARLKHTVVFTNKTAKQRTFRVVMKFSGITSDKVKHGQVEERITEEKHIVAPVIFFGEDNQHLKLSEYLWSLGVMNGETGEWSPITLKDIILDVHAQGCKADIIIGNYTLAENENLLIDPDTDTFYVGGGYDDAKESGTGILNNSDTDVYVNSYTVPSSIAYSCGGFRFRSVAIAQGSTVSAAKFSGFVGSADDPNLVIYGNDVDNALDFNDLQSIISEGDRPRTTASVSWVANSIGTYAWKDKTGLEEIVEEIVGRGGWNSGNALVLLFIANTDISNKAIEFFSYNASPSYAAELEVTWEVPPPPGEKAWQVDTLFKRLGIERTRGYDAAFQLQNIQKTADFDSLFVLRPELARQYDTAFQRLDIPVTADIDTLFTFKTELQRQLDAFFLYRPELARQYDAVFKLKGIQKAVPLDTYFAVFEATTWYGRISITDLNSVVHSLDPGVLGDGDALTLSLEHQKADDFFFSIEDYAGAKRDWLTRGCMIDIYIDRFKPPTTKRFHGMVEEVKEEWPMPATVVVKATGRDKFSIYLDRKVTETYLNTEISLIVKDLLDKYAPDLDQTNIDTTSTTLEDARFPYRSLKEILDYLGTVSGFTYRCDPLLKFYWKQTKTEDTGIKYCSSDISQSPAKLSSLFPIRNRVYVLGGNYMEVDQEQTTIGPAVDLRDKWYAQSFTPERSSLDQVSLHLTRTGDPANLEGEIRTHGDGVADPLGPLDVIATFTIDKDFIGVAPSWRPVRVEVNLLIGVKYWIVLKKVAAGPHFYEWSHDGDTAGEHADSDDGAAWVVRDGGDFQLTFKTHFSVPVLAVKQDYASRDDYMWREIVHEDKAIVSRVVARQTAQAMLDELKDLTPSIKTLRTINQTSIPDRGKLITVTLAPLKIAAIQYEVKRVFFNFKGGEDGTGHMDVFLGRSVEELDEWLNRMRLDIDRAKIGSFGIEEGLVPIIISVGPDSVTANDALNLTVAASGDFKIDSAKIDFSDIGD